MKKFLIGLLAMLLTFSFGMTAYALNEPIEDNVTVYIDTARTQVDGKTQAKAVNIQVADDATGNTVAMWTEGTLNGEFHANFPTSLKAGNSYTVYVADYEGGPVKKAGSVTAVQAPAVSGGSSGGAGTERKKDDVPKTGDYRWLEQ